MKFIKLGSIKNPHVPSDRANFRAGECYDGPDEQATPIVGEHYTFIVDGNNHYPRGWIHTSTIKCIYIPDTENDKLVLPTDFPEPEALDWSLINKGDILLATRNSIWVLKGKSK